MKARILGTTQHRLLDMLTCAADAGAPCPSNARLAEELGVNSLKDVTGPIKRLEARGLIKVQRGNRARIVEIVSTGKRTAEVTLHPARRVPA
ncbi:hypothetical protein GCM10007973_18190 [Polymorphobacter multimanifer]|uniref:DNA-binding MarR family transcriptional regulator n=1 Tax=Polymorphobacter multimanifer TaxID=1070431 RepID=A0A841L6W3_9SPHN|nr:hypothetical protein [Polymorphobacter multimanifer]MBB6228334.1 DNA-binding MarR family transcriptional regulator [Polymorphobacter multimanifer]GGI82108.1 hypothetical protein GCM10007973_18190 [Polymorphobacter multimanifer]